MERCRGERTAARFGVSAEPPAASVRDWYCPPCNRISRTLDAFRIQWAAIGVLTEPIQIRGCIRPPDVNGILYAKQG